ncbi:abortive phage resistance protein AbiGI [Streptococcus suis]|uniref:Abortive infection system antitoxin AbiGi family protein n=1 Tax=Streptococcus suis TaxID=1307 RepID=A0A426TDB7_STRSU|nr:abortive phage resistance protein AbiGI [Streptococcus suis]MDG4516133.1 abortive infection system antitoxin AbiGi family protein [Streptococcus suis]MDG4522017.1 abortive infection system antitoxin AbiGi family protein [Streptococcus suis]RRR52324.1 abortive phage resistance protein [Streptococcus suis]HEL1581157.1 abortive phage resistance protein [Streptococcus suis]HEL1593545.1 abortive phage resistance protein [Streptococcus suis]
MTTIVNYRAKEERDDFEVIQSKITANALFNFMREYSYLEKAILNMAICPRYYPEDISYLNLKYNSKDLTEWYIPMTCFCDIPLHQISYHAEGNSILLNDKGYGKFSIAFHKEFGIRKGIQPIHYLNTSSVQVEELTAALNILINKDSDYSEDSDILMNFIFEYIRMIKPYTGKMKRRDRDNNVIEIKKNFQDEHEWRYIPKLNPRELPLMLIEEEEIRAEEINKIYTDSILQTRDGVLKFDVEDIRYIFVDTVQNRNRLIQFIRGKRKGRRLSSQEKDILISKIMVYDELKEDW